MGTVKQPDIIRQTIIINDDYIRKNRRSDGKPALHIGYADHKNKRIILNTFVLDKNITLLNSTELADLKQRINNISTGTVIAHEYQHIRNNSLGYNYLANSDNIYESMILALADELSAHIAGYLYDTKDIDKAIDKSIENLSDTIRHRYIQTQFVNHFKLLQKTWGEEKNLYEHNYDTKKMNRVLEWYFTINGEKIMNKISPATKFKFNAFITKFKTEIMDFIKNYTATHHISRPAPAKSRR
ncbi:MAG: hypothetical protein IJQ55_03585 [Alphaproteobacteria bacterium]|nr:hypothetical protein [Alphaproteobacteria bacterium]